MDQYIQQYHGEKTEMRCYVLTPKLCIKDSDLNELEEILFEGKLVMCPANITHHLSDYFGDYMNLPPESKRVGHKLEELKL